MTTTPQTPAPATEPGTEPGTALGDVPPAAPKLGDAPANAAAGTTPDDGALNVGASAAEAAPAVSPAPPSLPTAVPFIALPLTEAQRAVERRIMTALVLVAVAFSIAAIIYRWGMMFLPWSLDGDQPQAVWHYWRYRVSGAFPPGDLMTDYAFVMHAPPVWWALMASLSTFLSPVVAAKVLNVVAFIAAIAALYVAVRRRSAPLVAMAAVFLLIRSVDFTGIIAGGYARSFGPALTLLFLAAFLVENHRAALFILVFQAAFYPSVVIPCGLAYGIYVVVKGPMPLRLRRMATLAVAGVLIIAFGEFQSLSAPKWWGGLVTEAEALQMPAWQAGGRVTEAPLKPIAVELPRHFARAWRTAGHAVFESGKAPSNALPVAANLLLAAFGVAGALIAVNKKRAAAPLPPGAESRAAPLPWQIPLVFVAAFLGYLLARQLAFKLYLPYRPLQHVWPYMIYAGLPLAVWSVVRALDSHTLRAQLVTFALCTVPAFAVFGDGLEGQPGYQEHARFAPLYQWVRSQPVEKTFAGEFALNDKLPVQTWHRVYVTRNLAHPFRAGYYAECEKRIRAMYGALYAGKWSEVAAFADASNTDYMVYRTSSFDNVDPQLFNPIKPDMAKLLRARQKTGLVFTAPPPEAVAFQSGPIRVVDLHIIKDMLSRGVLADAAPVPVPRAPAPKRSAPKGAALGDGEAPIGSLRVPTRETLDALRARAQALKKPPPLDPARAAEPTSTESATESDDEPPPRDEDDQ